MLTLCAEQNKKHKQTVESAQYELEISFNARSTCFQFDIFHISLFLLDSILFLVIGLEFEMYFSSEHCYLFHDYYFIGFLQFQDWPFDTDYLQRQMKPFTN